MFVHNVGPLIEILYLDLLNLNGGIVYIKIFLLVCSVFIIQ